MKYRIVKLQGNESEDRMSELIEEAVKSLKLGHVIAIPTDTIYGIAALAQSTTAVEQLYEIKERHQEKPIAICVGDVDDVKKWGKVTACDNILHNLLPGPVTLVFERTKELNPGLNAGTKLVGIRIPNHLFVQRLAKACQEPIALTSANKSAGMSSLKVEEFKSLWPKLDLIVDGGLLGQSQACRQGSTVINLSVPEEFSIIREGRYAIPGGGLWGKSISAYQHTLSILEDKYGLINADKK